MALALVHLFLQLQHRKVKIVFAAFQWLAFEEPVKIVSFLDLDLQCLKISLETKFKFGVLFPTVRFHAIVSTGQGKKSVDQEGRPSYGLPSLFDCHDVSHTTKGVGVFRHISSHFGYGPTKFLSLAGLASLTVLDSGLHGAEHPGSFFGGGEGGWVGGGSGLPPVDGGGEQLLDNDFVGFLVVIGHMLLLCGFYLFLLLLVSHLLMITRN